MGLTERHFFEDEEPEFTENQLEDVLLERDKAYKKGYADAMKNAVPLDKLCEYLSATCACPPNKEEIQKRCLTAQCALCWKESITKWMEEQDTEDGN